MLFKKCLDKQRDEEARSEFDHATRTGRSTAVPFPIAPINVGSYKRALYREKICSLFQLREVPCNASSSAHSVCPFKTAQWCGVFPIESTAKEFAPASSNTEITSK
jgi:hypothetical protein